MGTDCWLAVLMQIFAPVDVSHLRDILRSTGGASSCFTPALPAEYARHYRDMSTCIQTSVEAHRIDYYTDSRYIDMGVRSAGLRLTVLSSLRHLTPTKLRVLYSFSYSSRPRFISPGYYASANLIFRPSFSIRVLVNNDGFHVLIRAFLSSQGSFFSFLSR